MKAINDVLDYLDQATVAFEAATKDGKLDYTDGLTFMPLVLSGDKLVKAVPGAAGELVGAVKNLDEQQALDLFKAGQRAVALGKRLFAACKKLGPGK